MPEHIDITSERMVISETIGVPVFFIIVRFSQETQRQQRFMGRSHTFARDLDGIGYAMGQKHGKPAIC